MDVQIWRNRTINVLQELACKLLMTQQTSLLGVQEVDLWHDIIRATASCNRRDARTPQHFLQDNDRRIFLGYVLVNHDVGQLRLVFP